MCCVAKSITFAVETNVEPAILNRFTVIDCVHHGEGRVSATLKLCAMNGNQWIIYTVLWIFLLLSKAKVCVSHKLSQISTRARIYYLNRPVIIYNYGHDNLEGSH